MFTTQSRVLLLVLAIAGAAAGAPQALAEAAVFRHSVVKNNRAENGRATVIDHPSVNGNHQDEIGCASRLLPKGCFERF